ncbi:alpha/beta hydrolase [Novosphingobium umbonatum]|uniref:Alpha/beta hydrolase n=1 Tax=Novosphingobium umbonatum TaxID=1908524 RepID=A0A3S2VRE7_9SPHN|nr:alpha/beta hydrolase [Novosphingobium umbonatum]RVU03754.1 alpha/beta hydrolase [Novosphingobium umbonatum]
MMSETLPLLLVPGLICDSRVFAAQAAAFPQAQCLGGWGACDSLAAMAQRLLDKAPERFALLGHSMGARVALEAYRMAPERIDRLALVSTGTHPVAQGEAEKRYALRDLGREQGMAALVDQWLPPMIAPDNRPALYAPLHAMAAEQGLPAFEAQITALLSRPTLESLLPTITCPLLSCTGALDAWSPPAQAQAIADAAPRATLEIIPEAGHFLPIERAEAFNAAIARWLNIHP